MYISKEWQNTLHSSAQLTLRNMVCMGNRSLHSIMSILFGHYTVYMEFHYRRNGLRNLDIVFMAYSMTFYGIILDSFICFCTKHKQIMRFPVMIELFFWFEFIYCIIWRALCNRLQICNIGRIQNRDEALGKRRTPWPRKITLAILSLDQPGLQQLDN